MKHVFLIFVSLYFGLVLNVFAQSETSDSESTKINQIIQKRGLSREHLGIEISIGSKKVFLLNEGKKFIPASVTKLVTSYTILKQMPLNYKFKTELYYDSKNLYIKGGGDPSFVSENMWYLVNEFVRKNIKSVKDIIVDDTLFDQVRYDQSRESVRVDRSYDAPIGAMSFNWNSINIFVKPNQLNQQANVYLDPDNQYFKLINKTQTNDNKSAKELVIDVNQEQKIITVHGDVHSKVDEKAYFKNVSDPVLWTAENLKAFLNQRGIVTTGQLRAGTVPADALKVATSESKSINQILIDMNKFSNNFVAEMLTKNLASLSGEKPAKLSTGVEQIRNELKQIGLTEKEMYIENPSGFSRDNKFTARGLNKVLEVVQNDFQIFPGFVESLPILGIDGTLKKRMKNSPITGLVRAKTGYLDGVIALAGYAGRANGDILHFSFLYNGPRDMKLVQETFDQILVQILK
jgi:D-alanyl-D-alanine carboxypeptidase/D-alanyl-D-alanine-endopeptidase (penicillin-binding protein 4)